MSPLLLRPPRFAVSAFRSICCCWAISAAPGNIWLNWLNKAISGYMVGACWGIMGVKADRKLARLARLLCRVCCCPGIAAAARASVRVGITATGRVGFAASEDILVLGNKCSDVLLRHPWRDSRQRAGLLTCPITNSEKQSFECPCDSC